MLLEAFGLALPFDSPYSTDESFHYDFDCLSAISLPLISTATSSPTQPYPSTSLDGYSDYGSIQAAVQYSKQAFDISSNADHRFKAFLSLFGLQAVNAELVTIYPPQVADTRIHTSEATGSKTVKKKDSETPRKAAHEAVCCNEPDAEPHWHMWTVSHCY